MLPMTITVMNIVRQALGRYTRTAAQLQLHALSTSRFYENVQYLSLLCVLAKEHTIKRLS